MFAVIVFSFKELFYFFLYHPVRIYYDFSSKNIIGFLGEGVLCVVCFHFLSCCGVIQVLVMLDCSFLFKDEILICYL